MIMVRLIMVIIEKVITNDGLTMARHRSIIIGEQMFNQARALEEKTMTYQEPLTVELVVMHRIEEQNMRSFDCASSRYLQDSSRNMKTLYCTSSSYPS